jgi:hypothetical protein
MMHPIYPWCGLQNGQGSWATLVPWLAILQGEKEYPLEAYRQLHSVIADTIAQHFHTVMTDGGTKKLWSSDFDDYCESASGMRDLLLSIQRRLGNNHTLASSDAITEKIKEELSRVKWAKKPPELTAWSCISLPPALHPIKKSFTLLSFTHPYTPQDAYHSCPRHYGEGTQKRVLPGVP